jgi:flagellar biosynthesis protein FlhA
VDNPLGKPADVMAAMWMPLAMLALVALMVVPVPATVLDVGFIFNIMASLAVLLVALSAARPLDFSAFPTVLLLCTLFRLALNVASTRVVLMDGHNGTAAAGHVIEAFGKVLIGGDYVVGLFVFFVLMIINLIVIAKGAGRVSEVAARFTLDALPGKQMAIDSELAAGVLTAAEAQKRREEVAVEADFYGSMDGASKFVKGDAIAGILILFVSIIGGLILGIFRHDMPLGEAGALYISLAIGDALAAQIPALLLSIAAAAIVTRVASPFDLGGQIGHQFANANVWFAVGGIFLLLGMIPAMPQLLIWPAALLAIAAGFHCRRIAVLPQAAAEPVAVADPHLVSWDDVGGNNACQLEIGYALVPLIDDRRGAPLMGRITGIRRQLARALGFVIPPVRVADDLALPGSAYRLSIGGVIVGEDEAFADELLALESGGAITPIAGRPCKDPAFGIDALWIPREAKNDAIAAGYTVVDPATVIATHLNQCLTAHAATMFGVDDMQALLDHLKQGSPQLCQALCQAPGHLTRLTSLCRALLAERVPLRDFRQIAEAVVAVQDPALGESDLIEAVRQRVGALIVQNIVPMRMPLPVVTLHPDLESLVNKGVLASPGAAMPFDPDLARRIIEEVASAVEPMMVATRSFAIVVSPIGRAALARLLSAGFKDVAVLSYPELPPTKATEIVAVIGGELSFAAASNPSQQGKAL